jgi:hypothetical protein
MRRRSAGRVMRYGWTDCYHIRYHGRYLWVLDEDLAKLLLQIFFLDVYVILS